MSFVKRVGSFQQKKKKNEEVKDDGWTYKSNKDEQLTSKSPEQNEIPSENTSPQNKKALLLKRRKSFSLENLGNPGIIEAINQNPQFLRRKEMFKNDSDDENDNKSPQRRPYTQINGNQMFNKASKNRIDLGSEQDKVNVFNNNAIKPPAGRISNFIKECGARKKDLPRRKSLSLENICDSYESKRKNSRPGSHRHLNCHEELLSNFVNDDDRTITIEKTNNFPVDEVEIRKVSATRDGIVRSKTLHIDTLAPKLGSDRLDKFDLPGPIKIEIAQDSCIVVKKNDRLKYENGELKRLMRNGKDIIPTIIKRDVQFRDLQSVNKKEVQLIDCYGRNYKFIFEDAKAAKHFTDLYMLRSNLVTEKSSIKLMLRKFLNKRSSREQLESKGIIKDEPIFGNTLENIYNVNHCIPEFVIRTIELIERPENIRTMGLYRTSGNLATIQKIRLQVDLGKLDILAEYDKDVDVLTGSLKLFFRELKKPLLPCEVSEEIHKMKGVDKSGASCDKVTKIIHRLPQANRETLLYLLRHLLKVVQYREDNKMDIHNISVCWSPSIFAIPLDCQNILTFTTTASKSLEVLLEYYQRNYKELELEIIREMNESPSRKLQRQESKDSLVSNESFQGKNQKRSISDSHISEVEKVIRKVVELIELNIGSEGLYKASSNSSKMDKCHKKMVKRKLNELDKYAKDTHDLTSALKKYLRELQEPLIPKELFDEFSRICDITESSRQQKEMILPKIESIQQFPILKFLMEHLRRVIENDSNRVSGPDMYDIWTGVLTYGHKESVFNPRYKKLVSTMFDIYITPYFEDKSKRENFHAMPDVIKEVQSRQQRASSYDNVPDLSDIRKD